MVNAALGEHVWHDGPEVPLATAAGVAGPEPGRGHRDTSGGASATLPSKAPSGQGGAGTASSGEAAGERGGAQGVGEAPSHFLLWGFGFYFHLLRPGEIYFLLAILLFLVASMS